MQIEIAAVGGWGEVGRNMTAVRAGDDVVLFDMGLHMPNYIKFTEEEIGETVKLTERALKKADAVPRDSSVKDWRDNVRAIVISHAHLDHIGAVPYLAAKYDAPIICTPFSAAILRTICKDENIELENQIIELKPGKQKKLTDELTIEFVRTTHSTVQTIIAALHTPKGAVVYGNDYKLDNHPLVGKPPDYDRFKELGKQGVLALIQDCIYAKDYRKTPSEQVVKDMLRDVLIDVDTKGKNIMVTTFSSHIARLKTIADFGRQLGRKVVFMSRSIAKYAFAAQDTGITDFKSRAKILKYGHQIRKKLKEVQQKGKHKYLLVVSGHQGEPKALLNKMLNGLWKFDSNDHVIFAASVIPSEPNITNRKELEDGLKKKGARIFKDVHVSGHSSREDMRDIITMLKPTHLFPTHGDKNMVNAFNDLGKEMGYKMGKTLHPLTNNERKIL